MGHIKTHEDGFRVVCPTKQDAILAFKKRLHPDPDMDSPVGESAWIVGDSPAECEDLIAWADGHGVSWSPDARTQAETALATDGENEIDIASERLGGDLWPHQVEGARHLLRERKTLLTDTRGTGKTMAVLAALETAELYPSLVVTTASATHNWLSEALSWLPADRASSLVDSEGMDLPDVDLYVTSWDLLRKHVQSFRSLALDCVAFDEAHKVRNKDTLRSQAAEDVARGVPYRWGLTGTPIVNYVRDIVHQLVVVGRIEDFGGTWTMTQRHCNPEKVQIGWDSKRGEPEYAWDTTGASRLDDLRKQLKSTGAMLRRRKQDIDELDLPDKRIKHQIVTLSEEARQRYEKVKEAHDAAEDAFGHLNALRQAAARGKLPAAYEWIEERISRGEQVVVFSFHNFVLEALLDRFGGALHIRGGDTSAKRQERIETFQQGKANLIVCNIKAAGEAITLTAANEVLTVELWWNASTHNQSLDRLHRIGQDKDVTGWFLIAEDTIDEVMWEKIESRRLVSQQAIEDPAGRKEQFVDEVKKEVGI